MKPYIQSIPESALENVGISATLALALQLVVIIRSKRSFLSSLSALALTGIATGAISTVLARHAVLGDIHNKKSLQI
jgi:predicted exporter